MTKPPEPLMTSETLSAPVGDERLAETATSPLDGEHWKSIHEKLAREGGGTWAAYMMMDIAEAARRSKAETGPSEGKCTHPEESRRRSWFANEAGRSLTQDVCLKCGTDLLSPEASKLPSSPDAGDGMP